MSAYQNRWTLESILLLLFVIVFIGSGIGPLDRFTWFLEVAPAMIGVAILVATHRRFRFTPLAYSLSFVFACILCVGGHYTYAQVPIGNWVRDWLHLSRNHYDRFGHLAQGVVPAILARELLIRTSPLGLVGRTDTAPTRASGEAATPVCPPNSGGTHYGGKWLFFLVTCVCLAISATYELIEWQVAVWTGTAADAFLGTQGDVWDTQEDMATALVGAILAQLLLARVHDRQIDDVRKAGTFGSG